MSQQNGADEAEHQSPGRIEALEIERKYEARGDLELPAAETWLGTGLIPDEPQVFELEATYFDTADWALARLGLALRERVGGKDAGWHLKQKGAEGSREVLWPPSDGLPAELRAEIRERIGDVADEVAPIASLSTVRTALMLRDADGREAVEIADDLVRTTAHPSGVRRAWREWEAELAGGADLELLDRVEPLLLAAGAVPSLSSSKIARATGRLRDMVRAQGADAERLRLLEELDASDQAMARRLDV